MDMPHELFQVPSLFLTFSCCFLLECRCSSLNFVLDNSAVGATLLSGLSIHSWKVRTSICNQPEITCFCFWLHIDIFLELPKPLSLFSGIGVAMTMVSSVVSVYYSVLIAYIIYFFFASMTDKLPWESCGNSWNSEFQCLTTDQVANKSFLEEYLNGKNYSVFQKAFYAIFSWDSISDSDSSPFLMILVFNRDKLDKCGHQNASRGILLVSVSSSKSPEISRNQLFLLLFNVNLAHW